MNEQELTEQLSTLGCPGIIWERVPSNGWWRAYAATRRDEYGTPEDDTGNLRMGGGPTREEALTSLIRVFGYRSSEHKGK
jgi:hypothetical protein